jgi:hypothetical protein
MGRDQTRIALVAAILAMAIPASAYADHPSYVVQDLGALPADQGVSQAYAINNSGQVVGAGSGGGSASWIWDQHNGIRSLGAFPGGDGNTRATAINDAGVVVGFAEIEIDPGSFVTQGFFWTATAGMEPIPGLANKAMLSASTIRARSLEVSQECPAMVFFGKTARLPLSAFCRDLSRRSA